MEKKTIYVICGDFNGILNNAAYATYELAQKEIIDLKSNNGIAERWNMYVSNMTLFS